MKQINYSKILLPILLALFGGSIASANVLGDLNDDGQVDISDINIVINVMLGKSDVPADVNGDGIVDISDVNKVINIMLGKEIVPQIENGLYVGLVGFNDNMYFKPISTLDMNNVSEFNSFITSLDNTPRANILYYSVDRAIDSLMAMPTPEHLRNVSLVTLCHSLDMGSPRKSDWKYQDRFEYGDAIRDRIASQKVSGLPIEAFAVGLRGTDASISEDFADQVNNLVSDESHAYLVDDMNQLGDTLQGIADKIIAKYITQNLNLTTISLDNGMKVRYTFDIFDSADVEDSETYIEGTYQADGDKLTELVYQGLTCSSASPLAPTEANDLYLTYRFNDIKLDSGEPFNVSTIQEWRWNKRYNIWQRNAEFDPSQQTVDLFSSALLMLAVECSSTFNANDFALLKSQCSDFIGKMATVTTSVNNSNHFVVKGVSFDMIPIEGGTFMMGRNDGYDMERPAHEVTVSSFALGETEVTQALWQAVMGSNPSTHLGDLNCPVDNVSWNECQEFITKLNELTGKNFRLPTNAEWEFAARGGTQSGGTLYAGSDNIDEVGWYVLNGNNTSHPVASKSPNELGLYDMTGNVWEWCQDWYAYYGYTSETDPTGPESGSQKVYRGGSYYNDARFCQITYRGYNPPSVKGVNRGLRLAM